MSASSTFAPRFNIPSITDDISKWEEAWEEALGRLSSSQDVFPVLREYWKQDQLAPSVLSDLADRIRQRVLRSQDMISKVMVELDKRNFMFVMMKDEDVKRHLFNGMKEACARVSLGENAWALCPDITISAIMNNGQPVFDLFARWFGQEVDRSGGDGSLVLLRSEWWNSAVSMPELWPEDVRFAFEQLTLQRNEFISK